jgi:hypothetical protein
MMQRPVEPPDHHPQAPGLRLDDLTAAKVWLLETPDPTTPRLDWITRRPLIAVGVAVGLGLVAGRWRGAKPLLTFIVGWMARRMMSGRK